MTDLLHMSNVTVEYQSTEYTVRALDNVSLSIPSAGHTLGIVGESGSGKTTLGMSVMNVIEPPGRITGGTIDYMGRDVLKLGKNELRKYRWQEVAMVYQSAMNSLNPVKRVSDPIAEVLREHEQISRKEARDTAMKMLDEFEIGSDRASDYPYELSGGMRQRVIIALALALSPRLLIADEPTSALDVVIQKEILTLLKRQVSKNGLSLLFITHEISLLSGLVNEVAVMFAGEIVERGPIDKVLFEPLHPYSELLLSTLLTLDSDYALDRRTTKESGPYHQRPPENACKFSNRCKYAFDRCRVERPALKEIEKGRMVACHKYN